VYIGVGSDSGIHEIVSLSKYISDERVGGATIKKSIGANRFPSQKVERDRKKEMIWITST